jgi:hypothetical protein
MVPRPSGVRLLLDRPRAQSPLARSRCDLWRRGLSCHVRGRYPSCLAPPGSCARPTPFRCLRSPDPADRCRLRSAPAGRGTFPTCSLRILAPGLGPLLRRLWWCPGPVLPTRHRLALRSDQGSAGHHPYRHFSPASMSARQSCTPGPARGCARPPGGSSRCVRWSSPVPQGRPGFYVRAVHAS